MYKRKSRLTLRQQVRLLEHFVAGSTARAAAEIIGVQANTVIRFYMCLCHLIASKLPSYDLSGEVQARMKVILAAYVKENVARGASGKVAVFGLLKRGGKVYTAVIPNTTTETPLPIIQEKVMPVSRYNALGVSDFRHQRINHTNLFVEGRNHINGIETRLSDI